MDLRRDHHLHTHGIYRRELHEHAGALSNAAAISTPLTDSTMGNNSAAANVTSSNDSDMQLSKTASINPVVPGQSFNYTLRARDVGPLAVPAGQVISVTNNVPAGVTLSSLVSAPGWTCNALPVSGPATWSCSRPSGLAVSSNAPDIVVSANLPAAGTAIYNACAALDASARVDPNNANNCVGVGATASATQADLRAVSKIANPTTVVTGEPLTYVITVQNDGPAPSTNVVVSDTLASLITTGGFISTVPSQGSCTPNTTTNGPQVNLSCNLDTLISGAGAAVTGPAQHRGVGQSLQHGKRDVAGHRRPQPEQQRRQRDERGDGDVGRHRGQKRVAIAGSRGCAAHFRGHHRQHGAVDGADGPDGRYLAGQRGVHCCGRGQWRRKLLPITAGAVGGTLTCNWSSIAAGAQQTVTYRMRPLGPAAGSNVVNSIAATTATAESRSDNNSTTSTTPVIAPQLDILVNKVDSADPVDLGQSTTYTIALNNSGPSYGTNVVMTDVFPAPGSSPTATFSYQGSLTVNAGGNCTEPALDAAAGTLQCTFPGLPSGQSASVSYVVRAEALTVVGATTGTAFNRASVTVDETETTLANNVVTHDTTARRFAVNTDVAITKTNPATSVSPGGTTTYALTVINNGPLASDGAQVIDTLPTGVDFVSAPGCVNVLAIVTCSVGPLAVGASRAFALTVRLQTSYGGAKPLVNTASVDAPGDTNPANNTSTMSTPAYVPDEVAAIPTLSEWGMLILTTLMALVGVRQYRVRSSRRSGA